MKPLSPAIVLSLLGFYFIPSNTAIAQFEPVSIPAPQPVESYIGLPRFEPLDTENGCFAGI